MAVLWMILLYVVLVLVLVVIVSLVQGMVVTLTSVPWVRTPRRKTKKILTFAGLKPGERIVDFGSGDGSIVIDAARDFGAVGQGIERQWALVWIARIRARILRLSRRASFVRGDLFKTAMPNADVIFCYLFPEVNARLEPVLLERYPSGTRVVSRTFSFPSLPLVATERIGAETMYLYRIP
jgi:hypothetical protein